LEELLLLESLLEIDALDQHFGSKWKTVKDCSIVPYQFDNFQVQDKRLFELKALWQEAFEWSYYDQVLAGLTFKAPTVLKSVSTQAIFCIDDRECSIRRHIETLHPSFDSYGTPGHFNVEAYFQPEGASQRNQNLSGTGPAKTSLFKRNLFK